MAISLSRLHAATFGRLKKTESEQTQNRLNKVRDNIDSIVSKANTKTEKNSLTETFKKFSSAINSGTKSKIKTAYKQLKHEANSKIQDPATLKKLNETLEKTKIVLNTSKPVELKNIDFTNYNPKFTTDRSASGDDEIPVHSDLLSNIRAVEKYPIEGKLLALTKHLFYDKATEKSNALQQAIHSEDKDNIQKELKNIQNSYSNHFEKTSALGEKATGFEIAALAKLISSEISSTGTKRIPTKINPQDECYLGDRLQAVRNDLIEDELYSEVRKLDDAVESKDENKIQQTLEAIAKRFKKRCDSGGSPRYKSKSAKAKRYAEYNRKSSYAAKLAYDLRVRRSSGDQIMPDSSRNWHNSLETRTATSALG